MATTANRWVLCILILSLPGVCLAQNKHVTIVNTDRAEVVLQEAAARLQTYLRKTYSEITFTVADTPSPGADNIILEIDTQQSQEEYRIGRRDNRCVIAGGTPRAVMYGVSDLLEQLGWQFYLSYEIAPSSPQAWDLTQFVTQDSPLVGKRIIFNWHNFLSGCTAWDLEQWQQWIEQASKMKFNIIMVHAYANNPMSPFSYNGQAKALGYLSTTKSGRDWGTQHINDVRRLFGGELFDSPVFEKGAIR